MALNAAFFQDVTMFQPILPLVKWSRVEKRFASRNGGSKEVEDVMPKARDFVTAAIAVMGYLMQVSLRFRMICLLRLTMAGSVTGHCAALLMQLSKLPSYVSYPP